MPFLRPLPDHNQQNPFYLTNKALLNPLFSSASAKCVPKTFILLRIVKIFDLVICENFRMGFCH